MTQRPYLCREWLIEDCRDAVLEALDAFALEHLPATTNPLGAKDADLPRLFKAIDAQVDVLLERYSLTVPGEPYPEEFLARTKAQLDAARAK